MREFGQIEETTVRRGLLTLFLVAASVFSAWFGMSRGMPLVGILIPAIAILCGLLGRPVLIFFLVQFVSISKLTAPGLPSSFPLSRIFLTLLIGWALLDVALRKQTRPLSYRPAIDKWMWVFALNILLIIAVRGSGFAFMGGSVYGGAAYLGIWLSIFYYFSLVRIQISEKDVKQLIFVVLAAACLPMAVEVLLYVWERAALPLTKYISVSADYALEEKYAAEGVVRWGSFYLLGSGLITAAFVLCTKKISRLVLIGAALLLTALTGFRNILGSAVILITWLSFYFSKNRMKTFLLFGFLGLFGFGFLLVAAPMLPRSAQRAVSFLPGISVEQEVSAHGEGSTKWRVDMWRDYCIPAVPKYLLVGRGMSRDITAYAWLTSRWYGTPEFFYYMGAYHSGPFNLILNYGLPGTVSFILFFLLTIIDGWKTVRRYASRQDSLLARYYVFLTVQLTCAIVSFFLIFGDVSEGLLPLLVIAAQMRILKKNFLMEPLPAADVKAVEGSTGPLPPLKSLKPVNRWARPSLR